MPRPLPFLLLPLTLAACDGEAIAPRAIEPAAGLSAAECMNVDAEAEGSLGLWLLDGSVVPGAVPGPVTLGGIDGWLASVLTPQVTTHGRSETVHWVLHHVFVTDAPTLVDPGLGFPVLSIELGTQSSWFMTEDRAVCAAAGGGPATCRVNDQLDVVAGGGIFAEAGGFLHNHGLITITDPATGAGTGSFRVRGRVCGAGL